MMLVDVIGDELEAQMHTNSVQFSNAMDASSFESSSICHDFLLIHVQFYSTTPQDDEWINEKCSCLKKFGKSLREIF
jgi:hypothetical protein